MAEELDTRTAASDVMVALIKMRCRQHLHHAVEFLRAYREHGWPDSLSRANHACGVAHGQVYVLFDTSAPVGPYNKAVGKIATALRRADDERAEAAKRLLGLAMLETEKRKPQ